MSMTVNFYKYTGNPKKIHKDLPGLVSSLTIEPTDLFDDQQPQLILSYYSHIYTNANYCHIVSNSPGYSDYYFISQRALDTGRRMVLYLEKDLLMTNRAELDQTQIIVERSSTLIDAWMPDTLEAHTVQKITQNYLIGNLRSNLRESCKVVLAAVGSKDVI